MRTGIYIVAVLVLQLGACSPKMLTIPFSSAGFNVDGKENEWFDTQRYLAMNDRAQFALAHDNDNLYVFLKVYDDAEQMKVILGGLEVRLNAGSPRRRTAKIFFPLPVKEPLATDNEWDLELVKGKAIEDLTSMTLKGFRKPVADSTLTPLNNSGVLAALKPDDKGHLIYEAQIPFDNFAGKIPERMEIGFSLNGVHLPVHSSAEHRLNRREDYWTTIRLAPAP